MTRLVNEQRSCIRRAILAEVPKVDYAEKIKRKATSLAVFELPAAAKRLWEDSSTRSLLETHSIYFGFESRRNYVASCSLPGFESRHEGIKADPEIVELCRLAEEQDDVFDKLEAELRNNLASVNTHEAFAERWPELVRFLPDGSEAKVANLPATTALIDGLRAAGLELDTEPKAA